MILIISDFPKAKSTRTLERWLYQSIRTNHWISMTRSMLNSTEEEKFTNAHRTSLQLQMLPTRRWNEDQKIPVLLSQVRKMDNSPPVWRYSLLSLPQVLEWLRLSVLWWFGQLLLCCDNVVQADCYCGKYSTPWETALERPAYLPVLSESKSVVINLVSLPVWNPEKSIDDCKCNVEMISVYCVTNILQSDKR